MIDGTQKDGGGGTDAVKDRAAGSSIDDDDGDTFDGGPSEDSVGDDGAAIGEAYKAGGLAVAAYYKAKGRAMERLYSAMDGGDSDDVDDADAAVGGSDDTEAGRKGNSTSPTQAGNGTLPFVDEIRKELSDRGRSVDNYYRARYDPEYGVKALSRLPQHDPNLDFPPWGYDHVADRAHGKAIGAYWRQYHHVMNRYYKRQGVTLGRSSEEYYRGKFDPTYVPPPPANGAAPRGTRRHARDDDDWW
jgi:hypothetical protein